jgi:hypothetical protein
MTDVGVFLVAGFGLGLVHSFEPDHLAAMSTLVGRSERSTLRDAARGALWGLGHTLALGTLGMLLALAGVQTSAWMERVLEAGVGVLLVCLGILRLRSRRAEDRPHRHAAPLWIGVLHGMAGSGAVLALVPALFAGDLVAYLGCILAFGLGCILSMTAFCAGLGTLGPRLGWFRTLAGSVGIVVGMIWLVRATV